MTPSNGRTVISTLPHDFGEVETVETGLVSGVLRTVQTPFGSAKAGNVQGNVDAPTTSKETATQLEETSIVVFHDDGNDVKDEEGLERHVDDEERSSQARGDIGVYNAAVLGRSSGACVHAATVKELRPTPKAQLPEEANKAEAHNVERAIASNQTDELLRLLRELQDKNVALHASCSAETSGHAGVLITMVVHRKDEDILKNKLGKVTQCIFEALGRRKGQTSFSKLQGTLQALRSDWTVS